MKNHLVSALYLFLFFALYACNDDEAEEVIGSPPVAVIQVGNTPTTGREEIVLGETVVLNASKSSDPDGDELSYQWTLTGKPAESQATLINSLEDRVELIPDFRGSYLVELMVDDGRSDPVKEVVEIIVLPTPLLISGPVNEDLTIEDLFEDPEKPDAIVTGTVDVFAHLTVEPGVVVHFKNGAEFRVYYDGALTAVGLPDNRIIFTGSSETIGYWQGLEFHSRNAENQLHFTDILYAGGGDFKAGVILAGDAMLSMSNNRISHIDGHGVGTFADREQLTNFSNNEFSDVSDYPISISALQVHQLGDGNTFNYEGNEDKMKVQVRVARLMENYTWTDPGIPLLFKGNFLDVGYNEPGSLVIEEGVELLMPSDMIIRVNVDSYMSILGSPDNPVVIKGDEGKKWGWIYYFSDNENNQIKNAIIADGGKGGEGTIFLGGAGPFAPFASLSMQNVEILKSSSCGIFRYGKDTTLHIENVSFSENAGGDVCTND